MFVWKRLHSFLFSCAAWSASDKLCLRIILFRPTYLF